MVEAPTPVQAPPFDTQEAQASGEPVQRPVQQSVPAAQVAPVALHGSTQLPPLQSPEQQAPPVVGQAFPEGVQATVQMWVLGSQTPDWQSVATPHDRPDAHFGQEPPQSTSVSVPFLNVSVQLGAPQRWVVVLQNRPALQSAVVAQPALAPQVFPSASQVAPPQSTSVSSPFL